MSVRAELRELQTAGGLRIWLRAGWRETPSWTVSVVVHLLLIALLALASIAPQIQSPIMAVISQHFDDLEQIDETLENDLPSELPKELIERQLTETVALPVEAQEPAASANFEPASQVAIESSPEGLNLAFKDSLNTSLGTLAGTNPLGNRRTGMSGPAYIAAGGSPVCESAVAAGLKWLKEHQSDDGGWRFDHTACRACAGRCGNPGNVESSTGATGLVLLTFLGAGQTHQEGKHKEVVRRGLYSLCRQMRPTADGADFRGQGGDMYCHGLATIALCEAYAMTHDTSLQKPAQSALDYIVRAQDRTGGGWRYNPGQPGDTSVVGWQVMALKSGHLAYLQVPSNSIAGAVHFLDHVQSDGGAGYGYAQPGNSPATTSIGLLCRMYLGWKKENPALERGIAYLSKTGPSKTNMYYNYYATQVLHHWSGEPWTQWNAVMREQLVQTQDKSGHTAGSWWTPGQSHGERGGRLYETTLSVMTLEVYYRYLALYQEQAGQDEF